MADISTALNGYWHDPNTWAGAVVPGDGDTVTILHNVTILSGAATIVGTSPAENDPIPAITWGAINKVLTVSSPLIVRGDIQLKGSATKTTLVLVSGSGAGIEFDASMAPTASITNYRFLVQDASTQYTLINFSGSAANPVFMRSNISGGNAYFSRNGFVVGGWLRATYCDFTRIGDASNSFFDFYMGNNSGAEINLQNCIFQNCGLLTGGTAFASNATCNIVNNTWTGSLGTTYTFSLPSFTNAGTKIISGNVFDKLTAIGQGDWIVEGNLFMDGFLPTAGTKWASQTGNFVRRSTQPTLNVYGDSLNEFWYKDGSISNAHQMSLGITSGLTVSGTIFGHSDANAVGDAIGTGTPTSTRLYTIKHCILLPVDSNGLQPGKLVSVAQSTTFFTASATHNTYISTAAGETGISYGETNAGYDGIFTAVKSNLAWAPSANSASVAIRQAGTVQQSDPTRWDYNGKWNPRSGTDGYGYNAITTGPIFSSGSPGLHDVTVTSDPFYDRTRNLPTWDAYLGGPGTKENALAELFKKNNRSGYNPNYNIPALVNWIKEGFQVTDISLYNAGHDGTTIGAMPYYAIIPTSVTASFFARKAILKKFRMA